MKKGKINRIYKIIVLGDPKVGKRELITDFATQRFNEKYRLFILKSSNLKSIELKEYDVTVDLEFWDIARHPLNRPYFDGADGMLLVFDVTSLSTFNNIKNWYSTAVEYGLSEIPKILIGNKAHKGNERRVILPLAERLCEQLNIFYYYETSHFTGYNVKEVFEKIAELIYRAKVLNTPLKNQKLIVKTYHGETIKSPNYKIINPYWLDKLDNLGPITAGFESYPPCIEIRSLKKTKKKPLTEEQKRERKKRANLYFEKERKNIEKQEMQVKLIEAIKKTEEIKKDKPFIIVPSVTKSKTKEERKL